MIVTFADAVSYTLNYLAKDSSESPQAKQIVINAYRALVNKRTWNYYKRFLRLLTNGAEQGGTVQYFETDSPTGVITGATDATPIVISCQAHNLFTGSVVTITGVLGNTAANGTWTISVIDTNTFALNGSAGNGAYVSGGTWTTSNFPNFCMVLTPVTGVITNATDDEPIEITSVNHGLSNNDTVTVTGVLGNTAANGTWTISVIDTNTFALNGSVGNGAYVSGGLWSTITSWPPWILPNGYFRLQSQTNFVNSQATASGLVDYYCETLIDATHVTLDPTTTIGYDLPAGTQYTLMQDAYPLPVDFRSIITINWQAGTYNPAYVDVEEFANLSTLVTGPAAPYYYTIYGDRKLLGIKDIRFYPAPDQQYPTNLYYNGGGRPLAIACYETGAVSCAAGSKTLTGSGTVWTQQMVGSIVRLWAGPATDSAGNPIYPTGVDGLYPFTIEHVITAVNSPTSITLDSGAEVSLSGVNYRISDPIDCYEGAMMNFFFRECDKQARMSMRSKEVSAAEVAEYKLALEEAMEADSIYDGQRVAMAAQMRPRLLREYPLNKT